MENKNHSDISMAQKYSYFKTVKSSTEVEEKMESLYNADSKKVFVQSLGK